MPKIERMAGDMPRSLLEIHGVIGVWTREDRTFYVKRSEGMENYPGAWSLLSIQFAPEEVPDFSDLPIAQRIMDRMAEQRLHGTPLRVVRYLTSSRCSDNPMRLPVVLHLYQVELACEPTLNPEYYVDSAWLTPEEYVEASAGATCGLCMRMWSDYCYANALSEMRFAPSVVEDGEE